jgi:hypothetical protein
LVVSRWSFASNQLRIILHDQEQPPDRTIHLPVRGNLIGRRLRRVLPSRERQFEPNAF